MSKKKRVTLNINLDDIRAQYTGFVFHIFRNGTKRLFRTVKVTGNTTIFNLPAGEYLFKLIVLHRKKHWWEARVKTEIKSGYIAVP